jgi:uncharacterized membrane-anchored protein YitT (DUF2179 family)
MDVEYIILGFAFLICSIVVSIIINFVMDRRNIKRIMKWLKSPEAIRLYGNKEVEGKGTLTGKETVELLNQLRESKLDKLKIKKSNE